MARVLPLLIPIVVLIQFSLAEDKDDVDEDDRTKGIVYEKLADYLLAIDELHSAPFCCVVSGESLSIKNNATLHQRVHRIACQDSTRRLDCSGLGTIGRVDGYDELWWMRIVEKDGSIRYRNGSASRQLVTKDFGKNATEEDRRRIKVNLISPLGDITAPVASLLDTSANFKAAERTLLNKSKLSYANYDDDGNIVSEWVQRNEDLEVLRKIVWEKQYGYMPSDIKHYLVRDSRESLFSHVRCEYEQIENRWFPARYSGVNFSLSGGELHMDLNFSWRCGTSLKDDFIDPSVEDWRDPIKGLFEDVQWKHLSRRPGK